MAASRAYAALQTPPPAPAANGKIIFVSNRDQAFGELYTINPDGTGLTRLTNNTEVEDNPAYSPDGTKIAFITAREIYTSNADGTNRTRVTTNVAAGTENPNAATASRTVCDRAGNCATAGPITGNMIDKRAPQITITAPADVTYLLRQVVKANYSCADGGSGVAACTGTVTNGASINTSAPGSYTFTVNARDNVGNTTSKSVTYRVAYTINALYDQVAASMSGSTIPIKLQLTDAAHVNLSSANIVVTAIGVGQLSNNAPGVLQDAGNANPDFNFRYDATLAGYIFNLQTTGYPTGTYALSFRAGNDPVTHTVQFQIR